ncbi:GNAT family N-acetyltransferase [Marinobacter sp. M1N3S26]
MSIRKLSQPDLPDVARIQRECYSQDILESMDSFSAKLTACPDFCFMAVQRELPVGYVVALPWMFGEMLDLDGVEYSVPLQADSVCIHDLAVSPSARRAGAANQLLKAVLDTARERGYKRIFLVAIQGASSYWQRHGFEAVQVDEALRRGLSAYGEDAVYMVRIDEGA